MKKRTIVYAILTTALFLLPWRSQARWLKVETGRFMTMDTFEGNQENPQSLHEYVYCANNPVNLIDPSGHDAIGISFVMMSFSIQFTLAQMGIPVSASSTPTTGALVVPMTREQAIARYGSYKDGIVKAGNWPQESKWMVTYSIPDRITSDPDYNWINVPGGSKAKTTKIYLNKDIGPRLEQALDNLKTTKDLKLLETFDGCFNPRSARGSGAISAHAYGIALDINASNNTMGTKGNQPQRLIDAFTTSGFIWGGTFGGGREDPMHFSLGF